MPNNIFINSDPILGTRDFSSSPEITAMEQEIAERMNRIQQLKAHAQQPQASRTPVWDEIDAITDNMSQAEFKAMEADENYQKSLEALMNYVAAVQLQLIRPRIEGSPEGKKLLEQHLTNVKFLRKAALDDVNKKMADFEDYTKNYSHMSWEEYLKTKGTGGKKK